MWRSRYEQIFIDEELERLLSSAVTHRILRILYKNDGKVLNISKIAKLIDGTYSHVVRTMAMLEKTGLIDYEITGRSKLIRLTDKGKRIAELITQIYRELRIGVSHESDRVLQK